MKKIIAILFILALAGNITYAAVESCFSSAAYKGTLESQGTAYLFPYAFKQGTDTTYVADTSTIIFNVRDCLRLAVNYQYHMYDATCGYADKDSIKTRTAYIWSNDGSSWFRLDSSAAITDSLWHADTLIVRPFRFMKIIAYPSRAQVSVDDSAGTGPDGLNTYIPTDAYYRRLQAIVTPFYGNRR